MLINKTKIKKKKNYQKTYWNMAELRKFLLRIFQQRLQ